MFPGRGSQATQSERHYDQNTTHFGQPGLVPWPTFDVDFIFFKKTKNTPQDTEQKKKEKAPLQTMAVSDLTIIFTQRFFDCVVKQRRLPNTILESRAKWVSPTMFPSKRRDQGET